MKTTPRWLITVLRESQLDLPVLPWQRTYRAALHAPAPTATQLPADAPQLRKIA
jgi:hypothetical protein